MRGLVWSVIVLVAFVAASCRAPTEVRVVVKSDACTPTSTTTITTGSLGDIETKPPGPTSSKCDNGDVGSVVLQPSGEKNAAFAFKVVMGIDKPADQCTAPAYEGCIVARRALSFLPNEELVVVVDMRASCKDNPCNPDQTCVKGRCVTAQIAPDECTSSCTEANLSGDAGGGGGTDAGSSTSDSGAPIKDASYEKAPPTSCLPFNSECPPGSATTSCCEGSCEGSSLGWRCCTGGSCKVGAGDCCDLETCVDDGINGGRCMPR